MKTIGSIFSLLSLLVLLVAAGAAVGAAALQLRQGAAFTASNCELQCQSDPDCEDLVAVAPVDCPYCVGGRCHATPVAQ
ncbi:MAG: hypothetical protein ACRD13_09040 [Terriglobales bacterium]